VRGATPDFGNADAKIGNSTRLKESRTHRFHTIKRSKIYSAQENYNFHVFAYSSWSSFAEHLQFAAPAKCCVDRCRICKTFRATTSDAPLVLVAYSINVYKYVCTVYIYIYIYIHACVYIYILQMYTNIIYLILISSTTIP
jgi:hypothetical protein